MKEIEIAKDIMRYLGWNELGVVGIAQNRAKPDITGLTLPLPENKTEANSLWITLSDAERQLYSMYFIYEENKSVGILKTETMKREVKVLRDVFGPNLRTKLGEVTGLVAPVQQPEEKKYKKVMKVGVKNTLSMLLEDTIEFYKWAKRYELSGREDLYKEFQFKYDGAFKATEHALRMVYGEAGIPIKEAIKQLQEYWEPRSGSARGDETLLQFEKELEKVIRRKPVPKEILEEVEISEQG